MKMKENIFFTFSLKLKIDKYSPISINEILKWQLNTKLKKHLHVETQNSRTYFSFSTKILQSEKKSFFCVSIIHCFRSDRFSTDTISYMTPKILGLVPDKMKETKSMEILSVNVAFPVKAQKKVESNSLLSNSG